MSNLKPLFENTMIALSLQHMCFIATVSVATSQNTFNATSPTEIFGHSQKNFWTASFGILANNLRVSYAYDTRTLCQDIRERYCISKKTENVYEKNTKYSSRLLAYLLATDVRVIRLNKKTAIRRQRQR